MNMHCLAHQSILRFPLGPGLGLGADRHVEVLELTGGEVVQLLVSVPLTTGRAVRDPLTQPWMWTGGRSPFAARAQASFMA
jgi:hypothetical protein